MGTRSDVRSSVQSSALQVAGDDDGGLLVAVTVSVLRMVRQVIGVLDGEPVHEIRYEMSGKLHGGAFSTARFRPEGTFELPKAEPDVLDPGATTPGPDAKRQVRAAGVRRGATPRAVCYCPRRHGTARAARPRFHNQHSPGERRMGLIISLIIGGVIGWLASLVMKTDAQMGMIANVLVGIVGSALGSWIAGAVGIAPSGAVLNYVIAVLGAVALIFILRALGIFK
jgi:uncharacterized membrane protein YeaQ/YmgE (transglycosylase-associated protein family)